MTGSQRCKYAPCATNFYRPYVAWTLNARVTRSGVRRQLRAFASAGYGGVMVLPWGGTPYGFMSRSWLDRVAEILQEAECCGMGVWLWDDWLFPSGFAGGLLGRDEVHRSKKLKILGDFLLEAGERIVLPVPPRCLEIGLVRVNKYNNPEGVPVRVQADADGRVRCRADVRSRLVLVGWESVSCMRHTVRSHSAHMTDRHPAEIYVSDDMAAWSVDLLCADTTRAYLEAIHEKYHARLKGFFGKTLHGFFFDEPHLPTQYPWTPGLADAFRTRKGYDLTPWLVPLLLHRTNMGYDRFCGPDSALPAGRLRKIFADYHDVWTTLLAENFYGVIREWCAARGVLSIGHQGSDESVSHLLSGGGVLLKNMDRTDMPGIDVIWGQTAAGRFADFPRLAGSRASVTGKPFAVSESFAVQGHGIHVEEMRFIAEHQLVRGIQHFIEKVASYHPGKAKYFHPPELNPSASPMMRHFGKIYHDRIAFLSRLLGSGRSPEKYALYVPLRNFYERDPRITGVLNALAESLTYHQIEFDYVWEQDVLAMRREKDVLVSEGGQRYHALILPQGMIPTRMASRALKRLEPCLLRDGEAADAIRRRPDACPVDFSPPGRPISVRRRVLDDQAWVLFLLNEADREVVLDTTVRCEWTVWEKDLSTGQESGIPRGASLHFPAGASRLLFAERMSSTAPNRPVLRYGTPLPLRNWHLTMPDGRRIALRGRLPSWHTLGFPEFTGMLAYQTAFRWDRMSGDVRLDLGEVRYAATVFLDGREIGSAAFTPFHVFLKDLRPGRHTLEIRVLNTLANTVCGTEDRLRRLERKGVFAGTYAPIYLPIDRLKIPSGLLGPVTLRPVVTSPERVKSPRRR